MSKKPQQLNGPQGQETVLHRAVGLQREGRLDEAAQLYRQILARSPRHFDATQLLGAIALQLGDFSAAQLLLDSALQMNPQDTSVMANLGTCHMRAGRLEAARQLFESALKLQPESPMCNMNLGTVLHNMGRYADAIPPLRKAHAIDPSSYATCVLLGSCLVGTGKTAEADAFFEKAIGADADNSQGWEQLAQTLNSMGRHEEALEFATKAVARNPHSPAALSALGNAQFELRNLAEAAHSYGQAVSFAPPSANLFAAYASALVANASHDEAIEQYARALELDGSRLDVRWAMTMAYLKPVYKDEADSVESRSAFAKALADVEVWYRRAGAPAPFKVVGTAQPFYMAYQPANNRSLLGQHGALCALWMSTLPIIRDGPPAEAVRSGRTRDMTKLRMGVVSSHIHQHSVWNAITRGWIYNMDAEKFDIHLFKLDAWSDPESDKAQSVVAHFDDHPKDLDGWVRAILDQDLDVIIYPEIGMHTLTLQLASLRLAPVQAAAWGHPETTGLPTMDLYLSADGFEPPDAAANYVEKLVRLPNLGVYVEPLAPVIANPRLRSLNLSGSETLLLCPGTPFKYAPMYDDIWVQIARQLPKRVFGWRGRGRLVFFRSRSAGMDRIFEHRLRAAFKAGGVEFDRHVSIVPALERSRFFGLMRRSAFVLDTIGFSGFNTALQAIECSVPVLAFEGEFMRGRLASAIMRRLDLPELVATTPQSFVNKALELAADAGLRKKLSAKISDRRAALFHDMAPVRSLEHELTEAVARTRANPS